MNKFVQAIIKSGVVCFALSAGVSAKLNSDNLDFVYESLVKQSNTLKVSYVQNEYNIKCWVEREASGVKQKSDTVEVKQNKFKANPLQACLPRANATAWLRNPSAVLPTSSQTLSAKVDAS